MTMPVWHRAIRLRPVRPAPMLAAATLTWTGDKEGTARLDTGGSVLVVLPRAMVGLRAGTRVRLFHYPAVGWVVVQWMRFTDQPGYGDPGDDDGNT